MRKTWRLLPHDPQAVHRLASQLQHAPLVAQLLLNRGVSESSQAERFLKAPLKGLHAPQLLPGVNAAVECLLAAIRAGKKICVYGDYDVDGVTGTAILVQGLRLLGGIVDLYVPHRLEEGYGLNCEALRQISKGGAAVVVTVDCGITSCAEAEEAKLLGLELIITDHHAFKEKLPDATVLVHPRLPGTTYPFGGLSGAAVALKLAWGLAQGHCGGERVDIRFRDYLLDCVGLAALGVVADVVPLQDENRILVRYGLKRLADTSRPGLRALIAASGVRLGGDLRAEDIAFRLAPRLNAAGRLGCARLVVDLLLTDREAHAVELARSLEDQNRNRQTLERRIQAEAKEQIEKLGLQDAPALILGSDQWHAGIIGIVAGRLVDQYGRPALMIAWQRARDAGPDDPPTHGLGSARSIPGFAVHEGLAACDDLLIGHGGHPMAAGFRLVPGNLDEFRRRFCAVAAAKFPTGLPVPMLTLDAEAPLSALTLGLLDALDKLEPYGAENRKPYFLAGGLQVDGEPKKVGQGERHLSFRVRQGQTVLKAIAWGMGERIEELMSSGGACCLAFTPKRNEWQGRVTVDLEVVDFQAGANAVLA
jgi:single-stranded-DNA-specific exonuclease